MNQKDPTHVGEQTLAIKNDHPGIGRYVAFPSLCDSFPQHIWDQACRTLLFAGRENEVSRWLCSDNKRSTIAGALSMSVNKVHAHTKRIFRKARVGNRLGLAMVLHKHCLGFTRGLPRSNADKRKCVQTAFENKGGESDHHLAALCGVSQPFVSQMRLAVITVIKPVNRPGHVAQNATAQKNHVLSNGAKHNGATGKVSTTETVRRTNADKRNCVVAALKEFPDLSNRALAERCGVSDMLVGNVRNQGQTKVQETCACKRIGRDGKKYPAEHSSYVIKVVERDDAAQMQAVKIWFGKG